MSDLGDHLQAVLARRYRIRGEIGRGGMAVVYLGEERERGRRVAIKVLRPDLAARLAGDRFLREIQVAGRLEHPRLVPLYDSCQERECLYYVMPYLEEGSLRAKLDRDGGLAVDEAVRLAQEVAEGLAHLHRQGIIHRDVKPENILLQDGHALLADFGIARAIDLAGGDRLTEAGFVVGTLTYMSPEQALAEREPDGRSDVYALGCVLYEMLAGSPPYTGPTEHAALIRRFTEPIPSIRVVRADVPEWLDGAIARALARQPEQRFPSAEAFAQALGEEA